MRLYLLSNQETFAELRRVALREHRRPRDQAAVILESGRGRKGAAQVELEPGKDEPRRHTRGPELKETEAHDG